MKKYLKRQQVEKIFINDVNSLDKRKKDSIKNDKEALKYYWISCVEFLYSRDKITDYQLEELVQMEI